MSPLAVAIQERLDNLFNHESNRITVSHSQMVADDLERRLNEAGYEIVIKGEAK